MKLKILPVLILTILILSFFYQASLFGKMPLPTDTIVGLYHPYRDLYAKNYPNGIPYKNSLITDPVRQSYPWKYLAVTNLKNNTLPLWNPYNLTGTPLLANFQTAAFYPLNILFILFDFNKAWTIFILLQQLLAGIFMYLFAKSLNLNRTSSFLSALSYTFCGYMISWLEWGNIGHTILWFPLILYSINKFTNITEILKKENSLNQIFLKYRYHALIILSLTFSFFAGHLQSFVYLYIFSIIYFVSKAIFLKGKFKLFINFLIINIIFIILSSFQWLPTLQFLNYSARELDVSYLNNDGWFIPYKHLIQFLSPDFFGHPSTLNYWGVWNYGEFIGYISLFPLVMAFYALFFRLDKKTFFFGLAFFLSLFFALSNFISKIPYVLKIPFFDTAQPTRLIFIIDFSLSLLAGLGLDYFLRKPKWKILYPLLFLILLFISLWGFIFLFSNNFSNELKNNLLVSKKNLILPSLIAVINFIILTIFILQKKSVIKQILIILIIGITVFDLFRFGYKYLAFSEQKYLYPETTSLFIALKYSDLGRSMSVDSRILPPNFSIMHSIQSIEGYDPLYPRRYAELISAIERNKPDISPPFGFNRIITPHNYESRLIDLIGVKYIFSLNELKSPKLQKVFKEEKTFLYQNLNAFPRAFFIEQILRTKNKQQSIEALFNPKINLRKTAIIEDDLTEVTMYNTKESSLVIKKYMSDSLEISTNCKNKCFMVLTDTFYPTWKAKICKTDNLECKNTKIYLTDYNFRGVIVPPGKNTIIFYNNLL